MKTLKIILSIGLIFTITSIQGQSKKRAVTVKRSANYKINTKVAKKCNPLNIRSTENILRDKIGRTLKIYMDRDYGYVEIMGRKQNVNFGEYKVKKPGNNWLYFLNDVKSDVTRVKYENKQFYLTIAFEKERNEIKGKCPGCRVGNDKRAPDINWEDPKLRVVLRPIAHNGSFSFQVTKVELLGKFKLNGPTQKFLPSVATFFKSAIAKKVKAQLERTLNHDSVKQTISYAFKPEVRKLNLGYIKRIDMSKTDIYLCNH